MPPPEVLKFLFDAREACDLLERFTHGRSFEDYSSDPMLRSAVERQLEIVGEALNRALRLHPSLADVISDAPRIVAFRNRLVHGYAAVTDAVVWGVLEGNLPKLRREVGGLLEKGPT